MDAGLVTVTGGTGHLGNVLVRELVRRGHPVRVLARPGDPLVSLAGLPVEIVEGDVLRPASLAPALRGATCVFHLAGVVSISTLDEERVRAVNVDGTRNVLAACRAAGVRRLVYTSSVHALVEPRPGGVLDERTGYEPARAFGAYGRAKAAASLAVVEAARAGLDAVLVLPTAVVGPFDYRPSEMGDLIRLLARRAVPVALGGGYDFVDVRDVAVAHVLAAERGRSGESYLVTGGRLAVRDVLRILSERARRAPPRWVVPLPVAAAAARLAPAWERITRRRALLTPYSVHTLSVAFRISDEKARRELGFRSIPVEQSLRDAWDWMTQDPASPLRAGAPAARPARGDPDAPRDSA